MTINQLYNIFTFTGIMLLDVDTKLLTLTISPDYIVEKSQRLLGMLGKKEFIQYPVMNPILKSDQNIADGVDFWSDYSEKWKVNNENYELMNIFNFLFSICPPHKVPQNNYYAPDAKYFKPQRTLDFFEKFVGSLEDIPNDELLRRQAHFLIQEHIKDYIDYSCKVDRYLKLKWITS